MTERGTRSAVTDNWPLTTDSSRLELQGRQFLTFKLLPLLK
jgi:hypothetical protein